jgi:hypothetical protein
MEVRKNLSVNLTQSAFAVAIFTALALFVAGCASQLQTNPARSATEQLLLSTAADHALVTANFNMFAGRTVFVDFTYYDSYDPKYVEGEIRDALFRSGALLMTDAKDADVIIEARSGAYSIDNNTSFFGIPNISIPIPLAPLPLTIPEVAFYKNETQKSYAKFALVAYANKSRAHIYSSGPLDGNSHNTYKKILFISWWNTDIPEKQKKAKKMERYQTWFPQYDPENMPPVGSATNSPPSAPPAAAAPANTSTNAAK